MRAIIMYVGKYQSCTFSNVGFSLHAPVAVAARAFCLVHSAQCTAMTATLHTILNSRGPSRHAIVLNGLMDGWMDGWKIIRNELIM